MHAYIHTYIHTYIRLTHTIIYHTAAAEARVGGMQRDRRIPDTLTKPPSWASRMDPMLTFVAPDLEDCPDSARQKAASLDL